MPLNRCRLTLQGQETALNAFRKLGIETNISACSQLTGLDRATVGKIMDRRGAVQLGKVEIFWERLNDALQTTGFAGIQLTDNDHEEIPGARSPQSNPQTKKRSGNLKTLPLAQEVAEQLWMLDYRHQERKFQDERDRHQLATAFCIEASDPYHQWLTKRLIRQVPGWENTFLFETRIQHFWDLSRLWSELASQLDVPEEPAVVIKALSEAICEQSIILVFHSAHNFNEDVGAEFIADFWKPLNVQLQQHRRYPRARMFLFLTQDVERRSPSNSNQGSSQAQCKEMLRKP